jgi:AraC-like DNA-binding protein
VIDAVRTHFARAEHAAPGWYRAHRDPVVAQAVRLLTQWRLTLAADLLLDPRETVASVARTVGYGSPDALSAAFKRVRGVSPHQHRRGR